MNKMDLKDAIRSFMYADTPFSTESRLEQIMDRVDLYVKSVLATNDKASLGDSLQRWDMCGEHEAIMMEQEDGEFVKFEDVMKFFGGE